MIRTPAVQVRLNRLTTIATLFLLLLSPPSLLVLPVTEAVVVVAAAAEDHHQGRHILSYVNGTLLMSLTLTCNSDRN